MISADLGKQLESYIQQLVDTGRYGSKSEVLREGVRLVQDPETRLTTLDASIRRGIADATPAERNRRAMSSTVSTLRTSGIFSSAKVAMAEARQVIKWMRIPSATNSRPTDVDVPLRSWRPIGVAERAFIMHLLRQEFPGRAEILEQLNSLEVMRIGFGSSLKLRSQGP